MSLAVSAVDTRQRLQDLVNEVGQSGVSKHTSVAKLGGVAACARDGEARAAEEVFGGRSHIRISHCRKNESKFDA